MCGKEKTAFSSLFLYSSGFATIADNMTIHGFERLTFKSLGISDAISEHHFFYISIKLIDQYLVKGFAMVLQINVPVALF